MSKSMLLIICDFLVLSLIAFVRFDDEAQKPGDSVSLAAIEEARSQSQSEVDLLIEMLNKKTENLKSERTEVEKELEAEKEAVRKKLEEEQTLLQAELEAKQEMLRQRQLELERTAKNLENSQNEAAELEKQKKNLESAKAALQEEKASLQQEKVKLKTERDVLTGSYTEAVKARADLLKEVQSLGDKRAALAAQKAAISERLKNMQNEVERSKQQLDKSKEEMAKMDQARQDLQKNLATKEANLEATRSQLTKTESSLASAHTNITDLQKQREDLQKQRAALESTVVRTQAEKAIVAQKARSLEKETVKLQDETRKLEKEAEILLATRRKLENDKDNLLEQKSSLQTELTSAKLSIEAAKKEEGRITARITEVQSRLTKEEVENQRLAQANEMMRKTTAKLAEDIEKQSETARKLAQDIEKQSETAARLTENIALQTQTTKLLAKDIEEQTKAIAETTDKIGGLIEEAQPLSPNTIFTTFRTNQVNLTFKSEVRGVLGGVADKTYNIPATLAQDGQAVYAVCLAKDTPFQSNRLNSLNKVTGTINGSGRSFPLSQIGFSAHDPRVLIIPVPQQVAANAKPFKVDPKPDRFPKSILIDPAAQSFGEVALQLYPKNVNYFEFKTGLLRSIAGEFNAGKADYAFSQAGYLLGILVNGVHAVHLPNLEIPNRINIGGQFNPVRTTAFNNDVLKPKVGTIETALK